MEKEQNEMNWLRKFLDSLKMRRLLKQNEWDGLFPGDIVECKGKRLMFRGINKHGGPGMPGIPEPMFGPDHPKGSPCIYYIRHTGAVFPEEIFSENARPAEAGSTGISIGFLNAVRSDFQKVGHITPEQWAEMAEA